MRHQFILKPAEHPRSLLRCLVFPLLTFYTVANASATPTITDSTPNQSNRQPSAAEQKASPSTPDGPAPFDNEELTSRFLRLFSKNAGYIHKSDVESAFQLTLKEVDKRTLINKKEPGAVYGVRAHVDWYFDVYYWDISTERYGITMGWGAPPDTSPKSLVASSYGFCLSHLKISPALVKMGWLISQDAHGPGSHTLLYEKKNQKIQIVYGDIDQCLISMTAFGSK
ncbi:hypothetical protein NHH73_03770 [Oxalobacteraceae bacterium OTU3CINTB1]|nr:hypothetical protein NHH73_03770 [Oxalobacteraceae bacterium OTU3CINTB1]